MVTGDLNTATVEWVIQYRIREPQLFLFKVRDPGLTLRDISESVMRTVVGDRTVDEVITIGRQEIEVDALTQLQELVNKYELGLSIDQVQLKNVNPPLPVQPSFNEVNQAQQEREQMINVANGEYNKEVPRARGEAEQKMQAAEGYALKRVNEAKGDVSRFNAVLAEYIKAPEVTKQRIYIETMRDVVPKLGRKIIIDDQASQILPLLQLSPECGKELTMKSVSIPAVIVVAVLVVLFLFSAAYTVSETEQVIITQFGKPVGDPISEAGLHFKLPYIQEVTRLEKRILEWDGRPNEMPTKDKTYIVVDTFGRWKISDAKQFFLRLRDERSAQSRLDDILGSETRNAIAKHELIELVRTTKDREPVRDETIADAPGNIGILYPIAKGRAKIEQEIFTKAAEQIDRLWHRIVGRPIQDESITTKASASGSMTE